LLAAIAIGAALVLAARQLGTGLNYHDLVHAMRRMPPPSIGLAFAMTIVSYAALLTRDWLAARYAKVRPRTPVLLLASFCGYALGNAAASVPSAMQRYAIESIPSPDCSPARSADSSPISLSHLR